MQEIIHYLLHGFIAPSPTFLVVFFLTTSLLTLLSVTCFLHRSQTHHSIDFVQPINIVFRFILWFFTAISTKEWVAVHRKHHHFADTPEDPHSPKYLGLMKVLLEGADIYAKAGLDKELVAEYGKGTPDDWLERHIFTPHKEFGILITLAVESFLFGSPAIIIWALQMLVIPVIAAGFVNGITHVFGYQRYKDGDVTPDGRVLTRVADSRNVLTMGLAVGEEFHNNHHAFQDRYKFSHAWYEFDLGGTFIEILHFFRLAWIPKKDPTP